ncbi:MAG: TIGR00282 family metallophosphoesterase [Firmicutes bacterium]|nr:TIGR00282 family metallophosphoesterase [Bacillota bacterium]
MKILIIGDIVGKNGVAFVEKHLSSLKKLHGIDFCIANGENTAPGNGITKEGANALLNAGVNVITLGNHAFDKPDVAKLMEDGYPIIRPANLPLGTPGDGYILMDVGHYTVGVINGLGRINLKCCDCPFRTISKIVSQMQNKANIIILDFHAEATSEKIAMGYFLDGKVSAVVGTHTHVQTADERVLPGGTAYITDIGMTGPSNSVIGVKKEIIVEWFLTQMHQRFETSQNPVFLSGVIVTVDGNTRNATSIERISIS